MRTLRLLLTFFVLFLPISCMKKTDVVDLRFQNALRDFEILTQWQPKVCDHPLTLYEVVEIALLNNLDIYAQEHEKLAQARLSNAENLKMLPPLTFDGVLSYRFKPAASTSKPLNDDDENPIVEEVDATPKISSIQTTRQFTLRESLNLLDFALAYFRTKQAKNQTLLLHQQHLRARQKLILDIVQAYWKAVAAQEAIDDTLELIKLSEKFQEAFVIQSQRRAISKLQALDFKARLIDQQIQLEAVRFQHSNAKLELGGLMGLLPSTPFELAKVKLEDQKLEICDLKSLEEEALKMRPELAVKDLEEQIAIDKIRENFAQVFPSPSLYAEYNYDGNPFLVYNYWWTVGVRAFWNLFIIPQQWQAKRSAEEQRQFAYYSRLALSVAVVTQVHLAYINYRDVLNQYHLTRRAYETRNELAEIAEIIRRSGEFHGAEVLNFQTDAILAKINAWKAYSNLQLAVEQINYAIGRPLYLGCKTQK